MLLIHIMYYMALSYMYYIYYIISIICYIIHNHYLVIIFQNFPGWAIPFLFGLAYKDFQKGRSAVEYLARNPYRSSFDGRVGIFIFRFTQK